jgi:hypothetical protein
LILTLEQGSPGTVSLASLGPPSTSLVKPSTIEKDLKDLGFDFEVMWIDIDSKELKDIAKIISPLI